MNLPYFQLQARNEVGELLLEWPAMSVPRKGERIFLRGVYAVVRDEPLYVPPQGIGVTNPVTVVQLILTTAEEAPVPQPAKPKPKRVAGAPLTEPAENRPPKGARGRATPGKAKR